MGHVAGVSGAICGKVVIGDFPIKPVVLLKPDAEALIRVDDCLHPPPGRSSCPEESPSPLFRPRRPRLLTPLKRTRLGCRWPGRQQCLGSTPRPPSPGAASTRLRQLLGGDGRVPDGRHTAADTDLRIYAGHPVVQGTMTRQETPFVMCGTSAGHGARPAPSRRCPSPWNCPPPRRTSVRGDTGAPRGRPGAGDGISSVPPRVQYRLTLTCLHVELRGCLGTPPSSPSCGAAPHGRRWRPA